MSEIKTGYTTMPKEWIEKYADSLKKHIEAVQIAGERLGVPYLQLAHHDDSKYSVDEFPYYARQFCGDGGDPNGFARAWLHHIHENPHHWQYWIFPDNYELEGADIEDRSMQMPENYVDEMVADWLGSSYCYTGSWDMTDWVNKNLPKIRVYLHTETRYYLEGLLRTIENGKIYVE